MRCTKGIRTFLLNLTSYLTNRLFICLVLIYTIVAIGIKALFEIDICIPCLWKSIFGISCPGCGMTNAAIKLTELDIIGAYNSNALIFVVIPFCLFYFLFDYIRFVNKNAGP